MARLIVKGNLTGIPTITDNPHTFCHELYIHTIWLDGRLSQQSRKGIATMITDNRHTLCHELYNHTLWADCQLSQQDLERYSCDKDLKRYSCDKGSKTLKVLVRQRYWCDKGICATINNRHSNGPN